MNQGPLERASFSTLVIYSLPAAAAEISLDHLERTRVFGIRTGVQQIGSFPALGAPFLVAASESKRETLTWIVISISLVTVATTLWVVHRVEEGGDHQGRGGASPMKSFRDVLALLFIPLWIRLSPVIGKKKLWLFSMATMAVGYCGLFIVQESNRG